MNILTEENRIRINIVGIGGGGNNVINRMRDQHIPMVQYVSINTDDGAYNRSKADKKLQIGTQVTKGYGAGSNPEIGRLSAEEDRKQIEEAIKDCDILFITTGMGGGTGTGATPVVAEIARTLGLLTVAVVTKPFYFEGKKRIDQATKGIEALSKNVDSMILIPNDNLKHVSNTKITLSNAFAIADDVLVQTVKNIAEVIQQTAFINCDFADIQSIIKNSGRMHTATGRAAGHNRAEEIIRQIEYSPLLESSVKKATGILLCITASGEAGLEEIDSISTSLSSQATSNANIIFGMNFDETMEDALKAVLIATYQ